LNLGFQSSTIDGVLAKVAEDADEDEPMEALLRRALKMVN
jgi:Holliday junction resolvasome RuvABC DNA-binding subunit